MKKKDRKKDRKKERNNERQPAREYLMVCVSIKRVQFDCGRSEEHTSEFQ